MKPMTKTKLLQGLIALLFSLLLFFNAKSTTNTGKLFSERINYEEILQNVPVTVLYDSDKYFIHGFDNAVSVRLNSANRVQLNSEVDSNTRKFSVKADLRKMKPGTHEVKLSIDNLSSAVNASVEPDAVTVTIEKIAKKHFTVTPVLSASENNSGLSLGALTAEPNEVEITTGQDTLKQIDRVVASVDPNQITRDNNVVQAKVQALSASGEALAVKTNPETVNVTVDIDSPSKEVALYGAQKGTPPADIKNYQFRLDPTTATITGNWNVIGRINSIEIPIDVTNITETTEQKITIPGSDEYTVTPEKVSVTIAPVAENTQTSATAASETSETKQSSSQATSESVVPETTQSETSETKATTQQTQTTDESVEQSIEETK